MFDIKITAMTLLLLIKFFFVFLKTDFRPIELKYINRLRQKYDTVYFFLEIIITGKCIISNFSTLKV